jgi:hypothetical protein
VFGARGAFDKLRACDGWSVTSPFDRLRVTLFLKLAHLLAFGVGLSLSKATPRHHSASA